MASGHHRLALRILTPVALLVLTSLTVAGCGHEGVASAKGRAASAANAAGDAAIPERLQPDRAESAT